MKSPLPCAVCTLALVASLSCKPTESTEPAEPDAPVPDAAKADARAEKPADDAKPGQDNAKTDKMPRFGECTEQVPTSLHCGRGGDSPSFEQQIDCCTYLCMGKLGQIQPDSVYLLGPDKKKLPGKVEATESCVSFRANAKLKPGARHELVLARNFIKDDKDQAPLMNNAEESIGRFRFCFDPGEDAAWRNGRSNTSNGCQNEVERRAGLPPFIRDARYYTVARHDIERKDEHSDVDDLVEKGLRLDTRNDSKRALEDKSRPAVEFTFSDAAKKPVGYGKLSCDAWLCLSADQDFAEPACFLTNAGWFNHELSLGKASCPL